MSDLDSAKPAFRAPGSCCAQAAGCICPVIDNAHGKGYMGGAKTDNGKTVFVWFPDCPIHDEKTMEAYYAG